MVDVSKHALVPEHVLLSDEEADAVLQEYGIKRTDLPKIKVADPALPEEGQVGDVVKVVRQSRTTETAIAYRLVID